MLSYLDVLGTIQDSFNVDYTAPFTLLPVYFNTASERMKQLFTPNTNPDLCTNMEPNGYCTKYKTHQT